MSQRSHIRIKPVLLLLALTLLLGAAGMAQAQTEANVYITAQRFQNGEMIWRSDTGTIWVFYNEGIDYGSYQTYSSVSYGTLAENPVQGPAPSGLIRPVNGFGRVWGHNPTVRRALGWAVLPEIGYTLRLTDLDNTLYLTKLDGTVIRLQSGSRWIVDENPLPDNPAGINATADPQTVSRGEAFTVNWDAFGAQAVLIEARDARTGQIYRFIDSQQLSGTRTLLMPEAVSDAGLRVIFAVYNVVSPRGVLVTMYERRATTELRINVTGEAPSGEITVAGAYQPYENGFMIWRADSGSILVFFGGRSGTLQRYPEASYANLPDNPVTDPTPPDRVRPANGFGRVWGNTFAMPNNLGWALGPEVAFNFTQPADGGDIPSSLTLPDGRTLLISGPGWSIQ